MTPVIIVSGCPRSGTTLVMRMLGAGGIPLLIQPSGLADVEGMDAQIVHAENNLHRKPRLTRADLYPWRGHALKVLEVFAPGRPRLPRGLDYRVIWCVRDLDAQARSIVKYTQRTGGTATASVDEVKARLVDKTRHALWEMDRRSSIRVRVQGYEHLLAEPAEQARDIAAFLGRELDIGAMARLVDTDRDGSCAPDFLTREVEMALSGQTPGSGLPSTQEVPP